MTGRLDSDHSAPSRRPRWLPTGLVCLASSLAIPSAAEAQTGRTAVVAGRVVEAGTERSIPGAAVVLEGADVVTESDREGRFFFQSVPLGTYVLAVDHLAYQAVRDTLLLETAGATYEARVQLSVDAIELEPVVVTVHRDTGLLADVYDRMDRMRRLGVGEIFDRHMIEESGAIRVTHLVARLPGVRLQPLAGRANAVGLRLHPRNDCAPSLYIDGMETRIAGGEESLDDYVPLSNVEVVEVYRGLASLPGEFVDDRSIYCGAVAVWTRRGTDDGERFGWRRMVAMTGFLAVSYLLVGLWF